MKQILQAKQRRKITTVSSSFSGARAARSAATSGRSQKFKQKTLHALFITNAERREEENKKRLHSLLSSSSTALACSTGALSSGASVQLGKTLVVTNSSVSVSGSQSQGVHTNFCVEKERPLFLSELAPNFAHHTASIDSSAVAITSVCAASLAAEVGIRSAPTNNLLKSVDALKKPLSPDVLSSSIVSDLLHQPSCVPSDDAFAATNVDKSSRSSQPTKNSSQLFPDLSYFKVCSRRRIPFADKVPRLLLLAQGDDSTATSPTSFVVPGFEEYVSHAASLKATPAATDLLEDNKKGLCGVSAGTGNHPSFVDNSNCGELSRQPLRDLQEQQQQQTNQDDHDNSELPDSECKHLNIKPREPRNSAVQPTVKGLIEENLANSSGVSDHGIDAAKTVESLPTVAANAASIGQNQPIPRRPSLPSSSKTSLKTRNKNNSTSRSKNSENCSLDRSINSAGLTLFDVASKSAAAVEATDPEANAAAAKSENGSKGDVIHSSANDRLRRKRRKTTESRSRKRCRSKSSSTSKEICHSYLSNLPRSDETESKKSFGDTISGHVRTRREIHHGRSSSCGTSAQRRHDPAPTAKCSSSNKNQHEYVGNGALSLSVQPCQKNTENLKSVRRFSALASVEATDILSRHTSPEGNEPRCSSSQSVQDSLSARSHDDNRIAPLSILCAGTIGASVGNDGVERKGWATIDLLGNEHAALSANDSSHFGKHCRTAPLSVSSILLNDEHSRCQDTVSSTVAVNSNSVRTDLEKCDAVQQYAEEIIRKHKCGTADEQRSLSRRNCKPEKRRLSTDRSRTSDSGNGSLHERDKICASVSQNEPSLKKRSCVVNSPATTENTTGTRILDQRLPGDRDFSNLKDIATNYQVPSVAPSLAEKSPSCTPTHCVVPPLSSDVDRRVLDWVSQTHTDRVHTVPDRNVSNFCGTGMTRDHLRPHHHQHHYYHRCRRRSRTKDSLIGRDLIMASSKPQNEAVIDVDSVESTAYDQVQIEAAGSENSNSKSQKTLRSSIGLNTNRTSNDGVEAGAFHLLCELQSSYLRLVDSDECSDLVVETADRPIRAHKAILFARCPRISQTTVLMAESSFWKLSWCSSGAVMVFLRYIYAADVSFVPHISGRIRKDLLTLCCQYQTDELAARLIRHRSPSPSQLLQLTFSTNAKATHDNSNPEHARLQHAASCSTERPACDAESDPCSARSVAISNNLAVSVAAVQKGTFCKSNPSICSSRYKGSTCSGMSSRSKVSGGAFEPITESPVSGTQIPADNSGSQKHTPPFRTVRHETCILPPEALSNRERRSYSSLDSDDESLSESLVSVRSESDVSGGVTVTGLSDGKPDSFISPEYRSKETKKTRMSITCETVSVTTPADDGQWLQKIQLSPRLPQSASLSASSPLSQKQRPASHNLVNPVSSADTVLPNIDDSDNAERFNSTLGVINLNESATENKNSSRKTEHFKKNMDSGDSLVHRSNLRAATAPNRDDLNVVSGSLSAFQASDCSFKAVNAKPDSQLLGCVRVAEKPVVESSAGCGSTLPTSHIPENRGTDGSADQPIEVGSDSDLFSDEEIFVKCPDTSSVSINERLPLPLSPIQPTPRRSDENMTERANHKPSNNTGDPLHSNMFGDDDSELPIPVLNLLGAKQDLLSKTPTAISVAPSPSKSIPPNFVPRSRSRTDCLDPNTRELPSSSSASRDQKDAPRKIIERKSSSQPIIITTDDDEGNEAHDLKTNDAFRPSSKALSSPPAHAISNMLRTERHTPTNSKFSRTIKGLAVTPLPQYSIMDTPEVRQHLDRFGVKGSLGKTKGVRLLKHIYEVTHPELSVENDDDDSQGKVRNGHMQERQSCTQPALPYRSEQACTLSSLSSESESDTDLPPEETLLQADGADDDEEEGEISDNVEERIMRYIKGVPALHDRILCYEPLEVSDFKRQLRENGIRVNDRILLNFLDFHCVNISFRSQRNKISARSPKKNRRRKATAQRRRLPLKRAVTSMSQP